MNIFESSTVTNDASEQVIKVGRVQLLFGWLPRPGHGNTLLSLLEIVFCIATVNAIWIHVNFCTTGCGHNNSNTCIHYNVNFYSSQPCSKCHLCEACIVRLSVRCLSSPNTHTVQRYKLFRSCNAATSYCSKMIIELTNTDVHVSAFSYIYLLYAIWFVRKL